MGRPILMRCIPVLALVLIPCDAAKCRVWKPGDPTGFGVEPKEAACGRGVGCLLVIGDASLGKPQDGTYQHCAHAPDLMDCVYTYITARNLMNESAGNCLVGNATHWQEGVKDCRLKTDVNETHKHVSVCYCKKSLCNTDCECKDETPWPKAATPAPPPPHEPPAPKAPSRALGTRASAPAILLALGVTARISLCA